MRVLILCGGRGTRAYPDTVDVPKPLLPVGNHPLLRHVMNIFAAQGWTDFVLAAGYRCEAVEAFASHLDTGWSVDVVDTGLESGTGERIRACQDLLSDTFFATYGDGVGDVHLEALVALHRSRGRLATVTTVPLPSQYGVLDVDDTDAVRGFREKPRLPDHLINAGFLVMEPGVFNEWPGDDLERDVLPALASRGQLSAYRHDGFWASVDTYKDRIELDRLALTGAAPWAMDSRVG